MTRKEFKKSVWETVKNHLKQTGFNLANIKIDRSLPFISTGEGGFFAQGEDAQQIINEFPEDINEKVWLVYFLESAGVQI